jgi:hypothetical protein
METVSVMKIKRLVLLAVILVLVLPPFAVNAQDGDSGEECDPAALQNWLVERQSWRNATQDVLDAQGMSIQNARTYLHEHLQAIEDLERPACADSAMLWTYYLYTNLQHLLTCAQNQDTACVQAMQARLEGYREEDALTVDALGLAIGFTADAHADDRPAGWTMGPAQPTPVVTPPPEGATTPVPADDGNETPPQPPDPLTFTGPQAQQLGPLTDPDYEETYSAEVTVRNASFLTEGESAAFVEDGFANLVLDVSILNLGPDTLAYIGPDNFQVRDSAGELWDAIYLPETENCELDYIELEIGQSVDACVTFEVPVSGSLELLYTFDPYADYAAGQNLVFRLR